MNNKENRKTVPNKTYQGEGLGVTNDFQYISEYKSEEPKPTPIPPKQSDVVESGYGVEK